MHFCMDLPGTGASHISIHNVNDQKSSGLAEHRAGGDRDVHGQRLRGPVVRQALPGTAR